MEGVYEPLHHGNPEENRPDRDGDCSYLRPDMDSDSGVDRGWGVLASSLFNRRNIIWRQFRYQ